MAQTLLAIDWDHNTLRIVQADVGKKTLRITKALSVLLADDVDIDRPDSLGPFIARVLSEQKISTRTAVIDLPRDQVVLQKVPLPPTPEVDLAVSVLYQVGRELPFPLDEAVVDFVVSRRNERGLAVEAVAAGVRSEILARLTQTCEKAGLNLLRVGLRPYANMVAARYGRKADDESRMLFVDIGPELTEIDVYRGTSLIFSRSASVSIPILPDDEVQDMEHGEPMPERLRPVLDEVLVEVVRSLQAYRMAEPDSALAESVIAGGTGLEPAVARAMRERGDANVVLFNPSGNLNLPAEQGQALRAFAAALGLAIGSGRPGVFHLDFLHPKRPEDVRRRIRKKRTWDAIAAGVAALVLIGWPVYARMAQEMENARFEKEVVLPKEKEAQEVAKFKTTLDQLLAWRDGEYYWLDELQRLAQALPPAQDLYLTSLTASENGEFSLAGRVRDRAIYYRLANDITASGVMAVKLGDVKEVPEARGHSYPYRFDMKLELKNKLLPDRIRSHKQAHALPMPGVKVTPVFFIPETPIETETPSGGPSAPVSTPSAAAPAPANEMPPANPPAGVPQPAGSVPTVSALAVPQDVANVPWKTMTPQQAEEMIQNMMKSDPRISRGQALRRVKMRDFDLNRRGGYRKPPPVPPSNGWNPPPPVPVQAADSVPQEQENKPPEKNGQQDSPGQAPAPMEAESEGGEP